MFRGFTTIALLAALAGCGDGRGGAQGSEDMPALHRVVAFANCCRVPVPFDASATLPGNLIDSEVLVIERPGLRVKLDYFRQSGGSAPPARAEGAVRIDGVRAVLRDVAGPEGARVLQLDAVLPKSGSPPAAGWLDARAECASEANCAAARTILMGLRWM
ncbi:MAG TPA: hypothetical protein VEZ70_11300 [Allosphingosinicella sp.]|nr:hypothetical protein [Allosphingosinicella sp.]